jgi:radical SAM protein with 4Fe4S-binding SPASM domain
MRAGKTTTTEPVVVAHVLPDGLQDMKEIPLKNILTALTPYRLVNVVVVTLSMLLSKLLRRTISWGQPFVLTVEPTNRCNLACPQCDTGAGIMQRPAGDLSVALYNDLLQQTHRSLLYLILYDQGEPLLHPNYMELLRLAKSKRICVTCSSNGQLLADPRMADQLVASGLDNLILSVDGLSEETYQRYRRGGRLSKVMEAIQNVRRSREALQQKTPRICVQFIVMKHNEHELADFTRTAESWGADEVLIKSLQVRTRADAEALLPQQEKYRRYLLHSDQLVVKARKAKLCSRLWYSSVVHQDGSVVACCFDKDNQYIIGNVADSSFADIRHGARMRTFHVMVHGENKPNFCHNCTDGIELYK